MGTKTSVYLSDDLAARWRASLLPLSEIIRRGLDADDPEPPDLEVTLRRVIREELAAVTPGQTRPARTHALNCKCGVCRPENGGQ